MKKEEIISILKNNKDLISISNLANKLKIFDIVQLKNKLEILVQEKLIVISEEDNVYLLGDKYKTGNLRLNPKGFGFVNDILKPEEEAFFVPPVSMSGCYDGDIVVYTVIKDERTRAEVVELLTRNKLFLIGEISKSFDGRFLDFLPSDQAFTNFKTRIVNKNEFDFKEYQIIKAKIVSIKDRILFVRLKKIIGDSRKANDRIMSIAEEFDIKTNFNKKTIKEAEEVNIPVEQEVKELLKRKTNSLEEKMIVTIDGIDSKDLDDAICVEKLPNNHFKLYVAIADVSHYVKIDSALDNEALIRGNSTYLANKVIPMLPKILSNDLCSLNPNTKKFALACEMEFDEQGVMLSKKVYETIMVSKVRLNYNEVNEYIANGSWNYNEESKVMMDQAIELYKLIDAVKIKRGTITFDVREPKVMMDNEGNVLEIKARQTGESEKLIEQFMVSANEAVAEIVNEMKLPFIYRDHDQPKEEDLITWYKSLKSFGIDPKLTPAEMLDPLNINKTLINIKVQAKDAVEEELLNLSLLRYMAKAAYELDNIGHFGLSSKCYTHFTSPIRRYSDLIVHRLLKQYVINKQYNKNDLQDNEKFITRACAIINETETTSVDCEREVVKACMVEYLQDKIGLEFGGTISVALKFGIFVQLENMVEGLVHISNLEAGITYDETNQVLIKTNNQFYRMGQKVKIKIIAADIRKRKIDFILV
ncbi:ribonuclease R [Entomoplasma ellychniae]|uniref:Ribonuclease R n=1 Tax=Entomoplasma ellychniae TaxID=2114 RepID=A0A8E2QWK3_9MOLU|nr:ribonuclease R [Entomoplasma ellychniae]PPE05006.1 ribonuclease R [Entomoplasma ellychniae]